MAVLRVNNIMEVFDTYSIKILGKQFIKYVQ